MKQNTLAKGVCSTSYLCKIENNQVEPSQEILGLLLKRLEINIELINGDSINHQTYRDELFSIYEEVIQKRSISFTEEKLSYLQEYKYNYLSKDTFYYYKLLQLYLILILGKDPENTIELLSKNEQGFNPEQIYLYQKCLGIYYYNRNLLSEADSAFEIAKKQLLTLERLGDYERADLIYMNALVKLAHNKFIESIELLEYPKKYFINNIKFSRLIECLLVEGIAQQKLKNLDKARDIYVQALKFTENTKQKNLLAVIYQNLGSVNSSLDNLEESLNYYLKSYEMKVSIEKKFVTILSIIQIYSKLEDYITMEMWINKGLSLIENRDNFKSEYYHFKMYYYLFIQFDDIKAINEALSYFESENDLRHVYKYGIKIAEILKKKQKYKLATFYYERAILSKNKTVIYWEDL